MAFPAIAQSVVANNSVFNAVQGNQINYQAQQINFVASDEGSRERTTRAVVKWLSPLAFNLKHEYNRKRRQPGTAVWILDDHRFKSWLVTRGSFLWLYGIPGSGKSVLFSTVVDFVQSLNLVDHGFAYFYIDFSDVKTRQPKFILRSLLAQLIANQTTLLQADIEDLLTRMNHQYDPPSSISELTDLIIKASGHYSDTTLVIDALDECIPRDELLSSLERMHENANIHVFVTSRKERDIRDHLGNHTGIALDGESRHLQADVEIHIRRELEKFTKIPQKTKEAIINSLLSGADGMFRWVQCQLDQIRKLRTNKRILDAMIHLPGGLFETYDRILHSIPEDDVEFARMTLSWLVTSDKPIRLAEIVEAMAVDVELKCLDRDSTLNDEQDLLEICSSLVEYQEVTGVLSLSHHTVREYFLSPHLEGTALAQFKVSPSESHRELSKICLVYLLLPEFCDGPCDTLDSFKERQNQYPFLQYAASRWDAHIGECLESDDIFELLTDLLGSDVFNGNYESFLQARGVIHDKPPLSWFTNCRLTWALKRFAKESPPNWFNMELGGHGSPLLNAAFRDDLEMINYLLDMGVDINMVCHNHVLLPGAFPLYIAVLHGHDQTFDVLLDRGADPMQRYSSEELTPLHEACSQGRVRMIRELISRGVSINAKTRDGITPIHSTILSSSLSVLQILVDAGADILAKGEPSKSPLHYAIELRSVPIIEYLLNYYDDLSSLQDLNYEQIGWAAGMPWFARLKSAVSRNLSTQCEDKGFTLADVERTWYVLRERLPEDVTAIIFDNAECWAQSVAIREDLVVVDEHTPEQPYLSLIVQGHGRSPVRKAVFRTRSHDQGFSDYPDMHGSYRMSSSWFEVRIRSSPTLHDEAKKALSPRILQHNVHASWDSRDHVNTWDVRDSSPAIREWLMGLRSGDTLEVFALAKYPGWRNYVEFAEIKLLCA